MNTHVNILTFHLIDLRPPEMDRQMVNKTVRACCEGWAGPRCSEGEDQYISSMNSMEVEWNIGQASLMIKNTTNVLSVIIKSGLSKAQAFILSQERSI